MATDDEFDDTLDEDVEDDTIEIDDLDYVGDGDVSLEEDEDADVEVDEELDEVEESEDDDEDTDEEANEDTDEDEDEESLEALLDREDELDDDDFDFADDAPRGPLRQTTNPMGEGEFTCRSCFLVKRRAQLADADQLICFDCA